MNVSATEEATTIRTLLEGGKIWEPGDILSRPAAGFVPVPAGRPDRAQWFACSTLRSGSGSVNAQIVILVEQQRYVFEEADYDHHQRSEYSDEKYADANPGEKLKQSTHTAMILQKATVLGNNPLVHTSKPTGGVCLPSGGRFPSKAVRISSIN